MPEHMAESIRVITRITPHICQTATKHFNTRVDICGVARSDHLSDIVFRLQVL